MDYRKRLLEEVSDPGEDVFREPLDHRARAADAIGVGAPGGARIGLANLLIAGALVDAEHLPVVLLDDALCHRRQSRALFLGVFGVGS